MKTADDYFDAANVAELEGLYAEANSYYEKALEIHPDYPEVYDNRAGNWVELGEYAWAIADYEKVIAYWPDYSGAHDNLAQIYISADDSSFHNSKLALYHAKRSCELCRFSEYHSVSTLAAAHAANGQFTKAIAMQEMAIKVAADEIESDFWIPKLQVRLLEYRQKHDEQHKQIGWLSWLLRAFSRRK